MFAFCPDITRAVLQTTSLMRISVSQSTDKQNSKLWPTCFSSANTALQRPAHARLCGKTSLQDMNPTQRAQGDASNQIRSLLHVTIARIHLYKLYVCIHTWVHTCMHYMCETSPRHRLRAHCCRPPLQDPPRLASQLPHHASACVHASCVSCPGNPWPGQHAY